MMDKLKQTRQLSFAASQYTREKDFWLDCLAGEPEKTCVHYDFMDSGHEKGELLEESFLLADTGGAGLVKLSKGNDHRLHMILVAVVTVLLEKYLATGDVIVASPIYKQEAGGDFLNTMLMFRCRPNGAMSFRDYLLKEVRQTVARATEHQNYPLELLMKQMEIPDGIAGCPFFEVVVMLEDVHDISYLGDASPNIIFSFKRNGEALDLTLHFRKRLYRSGRMTQIVRHLKNVMAAVGENINISISDIEAIDEKEKELLTRTLNDTRVPYPDHRTLDSLLAETVSECENKVAVTFSDGSLSYGELWRRGLGLAGFLAGLGLRSGEPAAIIARHSLEAIVGIIGIVAAGGAYVPVNPGYPMERKTFLLQDAGVRFLLSPIELDDEFDCRVVDLRCHNVYQTPLDGDPGHDSRSPAYCMYTSGSTGNPKGVMVEHRSVVRLVKNIRYITFQTEDRLLQTAPIEFDPSTFEIWGMLLNGLGLFVVNKDTILDGRALGEAIVRYRASMLWMTTPLFNNMVQTAADIFEPLRLVMVGGDTLSPYHINLLHQRFPELHIMNMYGPTENTTYSTTYLVDRQFEGSVPIGKPVENSTAFILNTNGELSPEGIIGELWVGGDGVARGYLNNPELTAQRFKTFPHLDWQQMYWTGDWARWMPDGNLEFFGRKDGQVKIRGHRIEPMEIANQILRLDAVKEAVVVDRTDESGEKYLAAYLVTERDLDIESIKKHLTQSLPPHMMPSYFMVMDKIPLKFSGKVDKALLPDPQTAVEETITPPRTEMEMTLRDLWADVLGTGQENIGIDSDFFDIGGHSLKATILSVNIQKLLGRELTLEHIFEFPTIREMAQCLADGAHSHTPALHPPEERDTYPVPPAQARLLILERLEGAGAYNVPLILKINGLLELRRFEETIRRLMRRHDVLRASFHMRGDRPEMKVLEDVAVPFKVHTCSSPEVEERVKGFIRPFSVDRAPLFRVELLQTGAESFVLLADFHHLIMDGTSQEIFVKEFLSIYKGEELPPLEYQYRDFALLQQQAAEDGVLQKQEAFWMDQLSDPPLPLELPRDFSRPPVQRYEGARHSFTLDRRLTEKLKCVARDEDATVFMVLLSLFKLFLAKITGQWDLVVGTPVAGRRMVGMQRVLGMFVNTLALRSQLSANLSFRECVREVKINALRAFDNQDVPFEGVVEKLDLPRDTSRTPLFDVMFSFHNQWDYTGEEGNEQGDFTVQPYPFEYNISKFDLTLVGEEWDDNLRFSFEYSVHLFEEDSIQRLTGYFQTLVQSVLAEPDAPCRTLRYLTASDEEEVLRSFNQTVFSRPAETLIHQLLEKRALDTPDSIAAVEAKTGRGLTYRRLQREALSLAAILRSRGISPGSIVALSIERSLDLLKGIFGVLAAGCAYMPLEPSLPSYRRATIVASSGAVDSHIVDDCLRAVQYTDTGEVCDISERNRDSNRLAYVLYTSGSTGEPKGVMVEHGPVLNLLGSMHRRFPCESGDAYLLKTSCMFDVSVTELFGWLPGGGRCVISAPSSHRDSRQILEQCLCHRITHINFVPSMFNGFLDTVESGFTTHPCHFKYLMLAGEAVMPGHVLRYRRLGIPAALENLYGPTEATVYAGGYSLRRWSPGRPVPIGAPLDNIRLYVLDRYLQPVGIGVSGELYIAGSGLAKGYLNQPLLTDEAFITAPFAPFEKLYRTGDRVRRNGGGDLEFLGRNDHQVKVRGNRVETGEVEHHLTLHELVTEAVVIALQDSTGSLCLCGYATAKKDPARPLDSAMLKDFLSSKIPSYMVPDYLLMAESIPRTPSGKIDRASLPSPFEVDSDSSTPPRNEWESRLATLWSEALEIPLEAVDVHRRFFDSGGHSLKANLLVNAIHREFALRLPLIQIFKTQTVAELAPVIAAAAPTGFEAVKPSEKRDYYPLSPAQHRLFVLQQLEPRSIAYNMPYSVALDGSLELDDLAMCFRRLIRRHEMLRTLFTLVDHQPVQRVLDSVPFNIETLDGDRGLFVRPFDLGMAPLFRVGIFQEADLRHILMVDVHHIIADGSSLTILLSEFMRMFDQQSLPTLKLQYRDYALWLESSDRQEALARQRAYWLGRFSPEPPVLELPLDFSRPLRQSTQGGIVEFSLPVELSRSLRRLARDGGYTLFMTSLTLFFILLRRLSRQDDLVVGTTSAGRNHGDFQQVIGMFVNTLPIRLDVLADTPVKDLLDTVRDRVLESSDNQDFPFEELVDRVVTERDLSRNPLFDVMFDLREEALGQTGLPEKIQNQNVRFYPLDADVPAAKFDMEWVGMLSGQEMAFTVSFASALFKKETVRRFAGYYETVCRAFVEDPQRRIHTIELCSDEEKKRILFQFNDSASPLDRGRTILWRLEEQVCKRPDCVAVVHNGNAVSYGQLSQTVASIACLLSENGVKRGSMVAIHMNRGHRMLASMLGAWLLGGVYVPIETEQPMARIRGVVADSKTAIIVTDNDNLEISRDIAASLEDSPVVLDVQDRRVPGGSLPEEGLDPEGLAYVIYTSGTTGDPKGAMVHHPGMVNHLEAKISTLGLTANDITAQTASAGFDISVWQYLAPVMTGGVCVVVNRRDTLDPMKFSRLLRRERVSVWEPVPSLVRAFLDVVEEEDGCWLPHLRWMISTGEALDASLLARWFQSFPDIPVVNAYGPTECSDDVTQYIAVNREGLDRSIVPVGRPLQNLHVYIMDQRQHLCPVGVKGEICVSGVGVGPGYWNDSEKTGLAFVRNPLALEIAQPGYERLYKTGDCGYFMEDGNIVCLGRMDYQVKIKGNRIELGEVEAHLSGHPAIRDVVVTAPVNDSGEYFLCAYAVTGNGSGPEAALEGWREYLMERVPSYMVPAHLVVLESLPLTANGKIDRRALPEPDITKAVDGPRNIPRDELERTLLDVWKQVLGQENLDIHDNYFMIGGDSIKTIQIASRMGRLGYRLDMADIFRFPTVAQLAATLKTSALTIDQSTVTGDVPLTPIQRRFFQKHRRAPHHYNQAVMFYSSESLDPVMLQGVFETIVEHHDALRLTFRLGLDGVNQYNQAPGDVSFEVGYFDFTDKREPSELIRQISGRLQEQIDLTGGPLMKLALFHCNDGDRFLVIFHHLVIDGVSWRILFEDIGALVKQAQGGQPLRLPLKTHSYKTWAEGLADYAVSEGFLQEVDYWRELDSTVIKPIARELSHPDNKILDAHVASRRLEADLTGRLLTTANEPFGTEINDILLTGLGLAIMDIFGNSNVLVALEGHGREPVLEDIDITRTIGWFSCIYPVLLDLSFAQDLARQIKEVKERLHQAPHRGIGYGILQYLTPQEQRQGIEFKEQPQVIFNYLGQFDQDADQLPGLSMARESFGDTDSPEEERDFDLDISCMVTGGRMSVSVQYNRNHFKAETIEAFLDAYRDRLNRISEFCLELTKKELTPSDLTYKNLSLEALDEIGAMFDQ